MIYVDNDWYSNFSNAVNSNDERSVTGMVIDGISSVIADRRVELEELLAKANIPIVNEPSNEQLTDAITQNLSTSPKLRYGIAYLIAKHYGILSGTHKVHSRVSGTSKTQSKKEIRRKRREQRQKARKGKKRIDWGKTADTVTSIAGTLTAITDTISRSSNSQNQFRTDIQDLANNKAPAYSGSGKTGSGKTGNGNGKGKGKAWIWWLVGGAVVSTAVFIMYRKGVFGGK